MCLDAVTEYCRALWNSYIISCTLNISGAINHHINQPGCRAGSRRLTAVMNPVFEVK